MVERTKNLSIASFDTSSVAAVTRSFKSIGGTVLGPLPVTPKFSFWPGVFFPSCVRGQSLVLGGRAARNVSGVTFGVWVNNGEPTHINTIVNRGT